MEVKVAYFENAGKENTDATFLAARKRAEELGIKTIVVASTTGWTGVKASKAFEGMNLIIVSHTYGFKQADVDEFTKENRELLKSKGIPVVTTTHAFGGICRAMRQGEIPQANATYVVGDLVTATLRMFCHGTKVACEITVMAVDAGLVRCNEDIIAIAGTGATGGADTAIVVRPANAHRIFDMKIREFVCKPRL